MKRTKAVAARRLEDEAVDALIDWDTFAARRAAGENLQVLMEEQHALMFPDGCGCVGHHCLSCQSRIDETPHEVETGVTGRSMWRSGQRNYRCKECTYYD